MASDDTFDPWQLTSGLAEKYRGKISDPFFGTNASYNNGESVLLMFDVQTDDNEIGDGGVDSLQFTLGDGWEAKAKGTAVAREDGKKKGFNKNSGLGQLLEAAIEAGAGDALRAKADENGPMGAGIWEGLEFDWERKEFSGTFDGEKRTWARMLPVKFHGTSNGASGKAAAKPVKATPEAEGDETPTATGGTGGDYGLDAGLLAKLKVRAKKAADHDEFMVLCFDEIQPLSAEAEAVVMDADGFYAEFGS